MLLVLISFLGIHYFLGESNILTVVDAHNSLFSHLILVRIFFFMKPVSQYGFVIYFAGGVQTQTVSQSDAHITVFEGDSVELRCKYSYGRTPYLFWYIQHHGHGLQFLLKYYTGDPVVHGMNGFEAEFSKSNSSFHLRKASVHWKSDSAVYYCALSDTVAETTAGAEHKL
uniref:Ig-like domain-containing protein n=1 Tax=Rattus norvegicus TaxID=10116 RepID=A0A8I5ZMC5_RAT